MYGSPVLFCWSGQPLVFWSCPVSAGWNGQVSVASGISSSSASLDPGNGQPSSGLEPWRSSGSSSHPCGSLLSQIPSPSESTSRKYLVPVVCENETQQVSYFSGEVGGGGGSDCCRRAGIHA